MRTLLLFPPLPPNLFLFPSLAFSSPSPSPGFSPSFLSPAVWPLLFARPKERRAAQALSPNRIPYGNNILHGTCYKNIECEHLIAVHFLPFDICRSCLPGILLGLLACIPSPLAFCALSPSLASPSLLSCFSPRRRSPTRKREKALRRQALSATFWSCPFNLSPRTD